MIHSLFSFRSLSYFLYAIILTSVFLYVRFPAEKFKVYCERNIEQLFPNTDCTIAHVGYRFPLSAAFESIKIGKDIDGVGTEMIVEQLTVTPEPLRFWRAFTIHGKMYGGQLQANLQFDRNAQSFQLSDIDLKGVEAKDFARSLGLSEDGLMGKFFFSGEYQASNNAPAKGEGKGFVQLLKGSMTLRQPILALTTIDFEKVEARVTRKNGVINFEDGELLGADITADFTGEMRLNDPLSNSNILLSGHLQPDEVFLKNHPKEHQLVKRLLQRYRATVLLFKVGGTLKRPLFRFSK